MPNALSNETSPYLLQHAENPVRWYPWGPEALELARTSGKPILLSVGYSACHWCHVMAHESFEDAQTAAVMNERFINIKVDREERPDIDRIYQLAHQMLTQRGGGWPLTMFLSHDDQRPFFGGTYFPPEPRHGMPAFQQILARVSEYYEEHAGDLRAQNDALMDAFAQIDTAQPVDSSELDATPLAAARRQLAGTFDKTYGGFGSAPKFPHPTTIDRLMRDWAATAASLEPDLQSLYMATLTLTRMGEGGLYDQVGGGFSRYSVDAWWMIPHFEKMLYDNGALLATYANAAQATGEPLFAKVAAGTAEWVLRDMQAPEGGFYSSLDADSEHHEGKFYVWNAHEPKSLLSADEYAALSRRFGLDRAANFEGEWHLHAFVSIAQIARELGRTENEVEASIDSARAKLLAVRNRRIWPGRDDKVLTGWNAMMIRGLAVASRALQRPDLAEAASRALDYLRTHHWRNGRLLATSKEGRAHLEAYLDDYVLLADAILELNQVRWRTDEVVWGRELIAVILDHFEDRDQGGFFFTADDHERLIHRSKTFQDDATPAGNGVAAFVLQRYGYLLGEPALLEAATRTLRAGWSALSRYPHAHTSLLTALEEYLSAPEILILRGDADEIERWRVSTQKLYAPSRLVFAIPSDAAGAPLPEALATKPPRGSAVAYRCTGSECGAPVESLATLLGELVTHRAPGGLPGEDRERGG